jgi:hypothetical protein
VRYILQSTIRPENNKAVHFESMLAAKKAYEKNMVLHCSVCGTAGTDVKHVASYGDKMCSECRIEWRDRRE